MSQKPPPKSPTASTALERAAEHRRRLAEALRANLRKRKDQSRERAGDSLAQPKMPPKPSTDRPR